MEPDTHDKAAQGLSARRARAIILGVMAILIVAPFVVWLLAGRGAPGSP